MTNVLWSKQMEAAEQKRDSQSLYVSNMWRLLRDGSGLLDQASLVERGLVPGHRRPDLTLTLQTLNSALASDIAGASASDSAAGVAIGGSADSDVEAPTATGRRRPWRRPLKPVPKKEMPSIQRPLLWCLVLAAADGKSLGCRPRRKMPLHLEI
jgi:hypothetical protein